MRHSKEQLEQLARLVEQDDGVFEALQNAADRAAESLGLKLDPDDPAQLDFVVSLCYEPTDEEEQARLLDELHGRG